MDSRGVPNGIPFIDVAKDVIVIAIMGMTGSGKSTFIQKLTGNRDAVVGDGLESCTEKPRLHEFNYNGSKMIIIDTPGFDDTFRSDTSVLQDVAEILEVTYKCNMKLTGIVYLHRITDPRMTHTGIANLGVFRKLCGAEPMKNVILATTFWSEVQRTTGEKREQELRTRPEFWGEMIEEGASMAQFENTRDSAVAIILSLIPKGRVDLQIQKELCDGEMSLSETQAGVALGHELAEMAKKHADELNKVQQQMQDAIKAQDHKMESALKRQATKHEKRLDQVHSQQELLKAERRNEIRLLEQEFDRRLRKMEVDKQEESDERLKKALAAARLQDKKASVNAGPNGETSYWRQKEKRDKTVRWVRIGAAATTTAVSLAACIINPAAAGSAISSFVHLANAIFDSGSSSGPPPADTDVNDQYPDLDTVGDYDVDYGT